MTRARFAFCVAAAAVLPMFGCGRPQAPIDVLKQETWEISLLQGARIGYSHTTVTETTREGRRLLRIEGIERMVVPRAGQRSETEIRVTSLETPEGELIEFTTEMRQGATARDIQRNPPTLRTVGRVVGGRLALETTTAGKTQPGSIDWSPECGGAFAVDQSLRQQPMLPGQRRTLRALVPLFNQVAAVELVAKDYEPVALLAGRYDLLRLDARLQFPDGQDLKMTLWTDRTGEVLKNRTEEALAVEKLRASKAEALQEPEAVDFDLIANLSVKLPRPIPAAHQTRQIRYRVRLDGGDPASAFVSCPSQRVGPVAGSRDPHTAAVTVYALRPGEEGGNPSAPDDPPTEADLEPNNFIQSDDPQIAAMAREAAGGQTDPWAVAVALEQHVRRLIRRVDFSQALATAAEVARNPAGDCTEHAVLLAALCRARKIPARVAIGLVYMEGSQAFGYHMWTEVYIGKRWIGLDGTLGQGGIGAAHLKLGQTNLHGASAYSSFLPVMKVAGRLSIEVEEVK